MASPLPCAAASFSQYSAALGLGYVEQRAHVGLRLGVARVGALQRRHLVGG
ncbi:MAG: hypothetical protein R3E52_00635 [Burkholderiaceae bacterium]